MNTSPRWNMRSLGWCALAAAWLVCGTAGIEVRAQSPVDAYSVDALWPGNGPVIRDAVLLVQDGKIIQVGPRSDVVVPPGSRKHALGARVVIPGLVAVESELAVPGIEDERNTTPEYQAIDAFNFFEEYPSLLAGGITTIQLSAGKSRLIPGQGAVVKLAGANPSDRILAESESLKVNLSRSVLNPPTVYEPPVGAVSVDRPLEPSRPQLGASLAETILGVRTLFQSLDNLAPDADSRLRALMRLDRKSVV